MQKVGSSSSDAGGSDNARSRPSAEPDYWGDEAGGEHLHLRSSIVLHSSRGMLSLLAMMLEDWQLCLREGTCCLCRIGVQWHHTPVSCQG